MIKIICLIIAIFIIICFIFFHNKSSKKIEKCIEREDQRYDLSKYEKELNDELIYNKSKIKKALKESKAKVNTEWINSISEVMIVSNTLQKNLEMQQRKNLNMNKFHYYTNLHFRSMIAANLVYKEYESVDKSYKEINKLLLNIKEGKVKATKKEREEYWNIKEIIKKSRKVLLDRVHQLNYQTGQFRDKIRNECGDRGLKWYKKIKK